MMFKLSPRRNHRNKGFKVKHVLQICVLGGVCIWVLYQTSYKENNTVSKNGAATGNNHNQFIKLGRKGLDPHRFEEMTAEDLKNGGRDAEEGKSFDDENKLAELDQDQEKPEESDESGNENDENKEEESEDWEGKEREMVENVGEVKEEVEVRENKEEESEDGEGKETEMVENGGEVKGEVEVRGNKEEEREDGEGKKTEMVENGGEVKGEVEVGENNDRREEKEKQESKNGENAVDVAENGKLMDASVQGNRDSQDVSLIEKEKDEPENSTKKETNSSKSGFGSDSTEVKMGQENNLTDAAPGKTSLEDYSNLTAEKMETNEQKQIQDENGIASSGDAASNETNLVDISNHTEGLKEGNEQHQEHDNSTTDSTQTGNKSIHVVVSSGDGNETVIEQQTETSNENSTISTTRESTSDSTSRGQSSVSARQTEMNEGLTKQTSDSGVKINPSNDNDENNLTDSTASQNEELPAGSTGNPNDVQHNQPESTSSVLQEETDARTDMETAGENSKVAE